MTQISLNGTGVASAGALSLQSNGTTEAIGISTGQVATLAQNPILTSGTANGVAYLNGSKVVTSGSALVFDGTNLGVGVTPSAWASGSKAINVGTWGAISSNTTSGNLELTNNAYQSSNAGAFTYVNTQAATRYAQALGSHYWQIAASGTAGNAISFTQAMTLDASGNWQLGTTTNLLSAANRVTMSVNGNQSAALAFGAGGTRTAHIYADSAELAIANASGASGYIDFQTNGSERVRIDSSGNLLVGTTSTGLSNTNGIVLGTGSPNFGQVTVNHANGAASGSSYSVFGYNGGAIGSITQNGTTGVLFNTSSDYRLKDITGSITGAEAKNFIMALQPKKGTWKADGSPFAGFVAHEFQEVSPSSVSGVKDAVDEDGNPIMQAMQASSPEVMANLIAYIQHLEARITALEA